MKWSREERELWKNSPSTEPLFRESLTYLLAPYDSVPRGVDLCQKGEGVSGHHQHWITGEWKNKGKTSEMHMKGETLINRIYVDSADPNGSWIAVAAW